MNITSIIYYCHLIVLFHTIKILVEIVICHEDMIGERGGECHRNKYTPFSCRVSIFWQEIPSLLNYDDVIKLHH